MGTCGDNSFPHPSSGGQDFCFVLVTGEVHPGRCCHVCAPVQDSTRLLGDIEHLFFLKRGSPSRSILLSTEGGGRVSFEDGAGTLEAGEGKQRDFPPEPAEGPQPCQHPDFSPVRPILDF